VIADRTVADELAALHQLVDRARAKGRTAVVVERDDVLAALQRIETAHADATLASRDLVSRSDDVVKSSQDEASEILRAARLEQDRLVSDTEVFRVALREGEEMVASAREEAAVLRRETDSYVETRLASLQASLERTLAEVRRGISNLTSAETGSETGSESGAPAPVLLAEPLDG
jgi:cell division septum initiation protein DivIVA